MKLIQYFQKINTEENYNRKIFNLIYFSHDYQHIGKDLNKTEINQNITVINDPNISAIYTKKKSLEFEDLNQNDNGKSINKMIDRSITPDPYHKKNNLLMEEDSALKAINKPILLKHKEIKNLRNNNLLSKNNDVKNNMLIYNLHNPNNLSQNDIETQSPQLYNVKPMKKILEMKENYSINSNNDQVNNLDEIISKYKNLELDISKNIKDLSIINNQIIATTNNNSNSPPNKYIIIFYLF